MAKRILQILFLFIFYVASCYAHIVGVVVDLDGLPLIGANVYWAGSSVGVSTDTAGVFSIETVAGKKQLVASYVGYKSDTVVCSSNSHKVVFVLVADLELGEVEVSERRATLIKSRTSALNVQTLNAGELCKAACCNLSESFETSAAVDVAYSDAATGAKQIRLLGLAGTYVQLLTENTPGIRGLAQSFGMEYVPGPWMEAIQVSKGTASVINGYESTTGQINIEYLKPKLQDPLAINLMLNSELHSELNLTGGWRVTPEDDETDVTTGLMVHAGLMPMNMDMNGDSFVDMPSGYKVNLLNRWDIFKDDYTGRILLRGIYDRRLGGQRTDNIFAQTTPSALSPAPYLIDLDTRRVEGFMKNGYVIDEEKEMSIGIITAGSYHWQDNSYGHRRWKAAQANAYLNAMFQTSFSESHKLTTGLSLNHDTYIETLEGILPDDVVMTALGQPIDRLDLSRRQTDIGVFAEYSYKLDEKLSLLAGMRADLIIRDKVRVIPTPRFNLRYSPWEWWTIRASVGMGYRSPNVLADNAQYLPTGRLLFPATTTEDYGFDRALQTKGLTTPNMESALNAGLSTMFYIPIAERELQLSAEYYYTHFFDCLVADAETAGMVRFYNLSDVDGARAFSHTAQIEATMEILRGWTMTLAYRHTDSRQTVFSPSQNAYVLRQRPLQNRFKAIISTSYQTPLKKWQFDFTAQFNGYGRMPESFVVPTASDQYFVRGAETYHRWYPQLLGQITKYWRTCSLYVGAENMTNFRQASPIVATTTPFNSAFDVSAVWGPINGWKVYVGFRWNLERDDD